MGEYKSFLRIRDKMLSYCVFLCYYSIEFWCVVIQTEKKTGDKDTQ